jgi:hypothetical protein
LVAGRSKALEPGEIRLVEMSPREHLKLQKQQTKKDQPAKLTSLLNAIQMAHQTGDRERAAVLESQFLRFVNPTHNQYRRRK